MDTLLCESSGWRLPCLQQCNTVRGPRCILQSYAIPSTPYSLHSLLLRCHKKAYLANSSFQLWRSHVMSALCFLPKPTSLSCSLQSLLHPHTRTQLIVVWPMDSHWLDIDVFLRMKSPDPNCFQTKSNMLVVFQTGPRMVRYNLIVVYIFTPPIDTHQRSQIIRRDMPAWIIIQGWYSLW